MVAPIYPNKKGIYQDLYREIDSDNKKKANDSEKRTPKGIYKNLYAQIENEKIAFRDNNDQKISVFQNIQKFLNFAFSKASYIFSSVNSEIKMLILTFMVANRPINDYIENNMQSSNTSSNIGIYINDR